MDGWPFHFLNMWIFHVQQYPMVLHRKSTRKCSLKIRLGGLSRFHVWFSWMGEKSFAPMWSDDGKSSLTPKHIGWFLKRFYFRTILVSHEKEILMIKSKNKGLSLSKFSWYLVIVKIMKIRHSKGHISQRNHDSKIIFMHK